MIKCIYDECRWPKCYKTCGLVPKEEIHVVGSSAEEGLIYHLQGRIAELKAELLENGEDFVDEEDVNLYYMEEKESWLSYYAVPADEDDNVERDD